MKARFDGNSELVAELVTVNGFKAAYAIKDGAEGPRGWMVYSVHATLFLFVMAAKVLIRNSDVFKFCRIMVFLGYHQRKH